MAPYAGVADVPARGGGVTPMEMSTIASCSPPAVINETAVASDTIIWAVAVSEGKAIVARADSDHMRLGELADEVVAKYGDKTLAKFAAAIGVAACTLKRRRSVYRAWKEIGASPPQLYTVAQELAAHPDRAEIVQENPNITARKAREMVRANNTAQDDGRREEDWKLKETRRWFNRLVDMAEEIVGEVNIGAMTPERRQILTEVLEPNLLVQQLREGGEALVKLADDLKQLIENEHSFAAAAE
jgi:hypothetical protein